MNFFVIFCVAMIVAVTGEGERDNRCRAETTITGRQGGSWLEDGRSYQIYDIVVTNTGECPIVSLVGYYNSFNSKITQSWNYNVSGGEIYGFNNLRSGEQYFGAGIVISGYEVPSLSFLTPTCTSSCAPAPCDGACDKKQSCVNLDDQYSCYFRNCDDAECSGDSACTDNGGFVTCSSIPPCSVDVSAIARPNSYYLVDNVPYQLWDLEVTNKGYLPVSRLSAYIVPPYGSLIDSSNRWNLSPFQPDSDKYDVSVFSELKQYRDRYTGAGFIVMGPTANQPPSTQIASLRCTSNNNDNNENNDNNGDNNNNNNNNNNFAITDNNNDKEDEIEQGPPQPLTATRPTRPNPDLSSSSLSSPSSSLYSSSPSYESEIPELIPISARI